MKIVVDAMGGDFAPKVNVDGAIDALREYPDMDIILVGPQALVEETISAYGDAEALGRVRERLTVVDAPEVIMKKFKRAVTDCETAVKYDKENKAGISNLLTIYCAATGKTLQEAEAEFEGQGYGVFKPAVGEAVVELLRPIREESQRIMDDKAYLESVYQDGAERARRLALKTLSKVQRKVGFVAAK